MTFLPAVVRAGYQGGYRVRVAFNDGAGATISFRQWLKGPIFRPLLDLDYFRRICVDGGTMAWPNGGDMAPETLYAAVAGKTRRRARAEGTKPRGTPSRRASTRQRRRQRARVHQHGLRRPTLPGSHRVPDLDVYAEGPPSWLSPSRMVNALRHPVSPRHPPAGATDVPPPNRKNLSPIRINRTS